MNNEKWKELLIQLSQRLSTMFASLIGGLSNWLAKEWAFREVNKNILRRSTIESLFAKDGEKNNRDILLKSTILVPVALVSYYFLKFIELKGISLVIILSSPVIFWLLPQWFVKTLCNPIFKKTPNQRKNRDKTKILLGIENLLIKLNDGRLISYTAENPNGYHSLVFEQNERFGLVCRIKLTASGKDEVFKNWQQKTFKYLYAIPYVHDHLSNPMIISNSEILVAFDHFCAESWDKFADEVLKDDQITSRVPEICKMKKLEQAEQKKVERQTTEQKKFEKIEAIVKGTGINLKVLPILQKIIQNRDIWNISPSNLEKYLEGNKFFAKFRLNLIHNEEFNQLIKKKETLERLLNCDVTIGKIPTDKSLVSILLVFKNILEPFSKKYFDILEINLQDKLYLGRTIQGDLIAGFNSQANHFLVTGESGSGKSRLIVHLLTQLLNMNEFRFGSVYIGSMAKLSDYVAFEQAGGYLTEGPENVLSMVSVLLNKMRQREVRFKQHNVKNIEEYNASVHPDEKMERIVLVLEEYESTLAVSSRRELEEVVLALLSIGRSSGMLVIISSQSLQKSHIGAVRDKIMTQFVGYMKRKTAQDCNEPELGDYFGNLEGESHGIFFVDFGNLNVPAGQINHKTTNKILVRFPLSQDIEEYIPEIKGSELGFDAVNNTKKAFEDIII